MKPKDVEEFDDPEEAAKQFQKSIERGEGSEHELAPALGYLGVTRAVEAEKALLKIRLSEELEVA